MDLTAEQQKELEAITRIIRATTADKDMDTSFSVLLAAAKAIVLIEMEEGREGRLKRWRERADEMTPRVYQTIRAILAGGWKPN